MDGTNTHLPQQIDISVPLGTPRPNVNIHFAPTATVRIIENSNSPEINDWEVQKHLGGSHTFGYKLPSSNLTFGKQLREATKALLTATVGNVLVLSDKSRRAFTSPTDIQAMRKLVSVWETFDPPQAKTIVAPSGSYVETLNHLCQQRRLKTDLLNELSSILIEDSAPSGKTTSRVTAYVGDQIFFSKDDLELGVRAGTRGIIRSINYSNSTLGVTLGTDRHATIPVKEYRHLRLGYASAECPALESPSFSFVLLAGPNVDRPHPVLELAQLRQAPRFFTSEYAFDLYLQIVEAAMPTPRLSINVTNPTEPKPQFERLPSDSTLTFSHSFPRLTRISAVGFD